MKEYFLLQFKMTNRKFSDAGINPVFAFFIGIGVFIFLSSYIFQKSEFAPYLVVLTAFSFLLKGAEKRRTEFLINTYGSNKKNIIRGIENLLISIPFILLLLYHNALIEASILLLSSIFLARISFMSSGNSSLPTPFSKEPFEFTVGFRNTFFVYLIAYILTFIGILLNNFNVGIFGMLVIFLVSLSYYTKPENEYYVWIYSSSPRGFLLKKLIIATKNTFFIVLPVFISMLMFYWDELALILLFFMLGFVFLWTIILAKYSTYPSEMNIPEVFLIAVCIYFPPFLIVLIPYFYLRSIKKLTSLLI